MTEFCIGDRVRFRPGAEVSRDTLGCEAVVEGYIEADEVDYVVVTVKGPAGDYEQWVLPREIRRAAPPRSPVEEPADEDQSADFEVVLPEREIQ